MSTSIRTSMASYVGKCRGCRRVIIGKGKTTRADFMEQVYSGVKGSGSVGIGIRRLRWHLKCFEADREDDSSDQT